MPPQSTESYLRSTLKRLKGRLEKAIAALPGAKGVHAVRVSARRLRSVLGQFRKQLPPEARESRRQLRELASGFSGLRDLDVLLQNFGSWTKALTAAECELVQPMLTRVAGQRSSLLRKGDRALKLWRKAGGPGSLSVLCSPGTRWPDSAKVSIKALAPKMVAHAYAKFDRAARRARKQGTVKCYHKLRLRGKRLRYVLTALPGPAQRAKPVVKKLVAIQDAFGEYLDAIQAAEVLDRENRRRGLKPEARHAVQKLIERCNRHAEDCLKQLPMLLEQLEPDQWAEFMAGIHGGKP